VLFDDYLLAVDQVEERLKSLNAAIAELSLDPQYAQAVGALKCFRGIDTLTATVLVTELHSFGRFTSPRGLMAFLGLVPSEYSSSDRRRQGSITKAGNGHVRRLLIEAAWHYRHRPGLSALKNRREGQPATLIAIADRAMQRLHRRFNRMAARNVPSTKIAVAVARELAGFVWAALHTVAA
jgi:transposase